jgi:cation diffusion facilitator family transporter
MGSPKPSEAQQRFDESMNDGKPARCSDAFCESARAGRSRTMPNESTRTVWVSLAAGLGVALTKAFAAVFTGSPAMAAEASHSLADTANDLFLLVAQRRSTHHPDDQHPLGYGREAYFWALIAATGVFVAGAAFSLREGIAELIHPSVTSSFAVAYVVLAISAVFDLISFHQSGGQMSAQARHRHRDLLDQSRATSDPMLRAVFVEDAVATVGDVFAFTGLALNQLTGSSIPQGVAAVLIALVLARTSVLLIRRNHDFLVGAWLLTPAAPGKRDGDHSTGGVTSAVGNGTHRGEPAGETFTHPLQPSDEQRLRTFLLGYPGVTAIGELLVLFLGPSQVWVVARLDIDDDLRGDQIKSLVRGIEAGLKHASESIYRVDVVIGGTKATP